jgi:hypothetical protein
MGKAWGSKLGAGLAFGVRRSAFGVRRSAFGVRRSAFGVRRSAFGVRRSAFGRFWGESSKSKPIPACTHDFRWMTLGYRQQCPSRPQRSSSKAGRHDSILRQPRLLGSLNADSNNSKTLCYLFVYEQIVRRSNPNCYTNVLLVTSVAFIKFPNRYS